MPRPYIPVAIERLVRERARYLCEYCRSPLAYATESFCVEHIFPIASEGTSEPDNLAFSCSGCNSTKGVRVEALDETTESMAPLFHPRRQRWSDHFRWSEDELQIVALTPTGRATIAVWGTESLPTLQFAPHTYTVGTSSAFRRRVIKSGQFEEVNEKRRVQLGAPLFRFAGLNFDAHLVTLTSKSRRKTDGATLLSSFTLCNSNSTFLFPTPAKTKSSPIPSMML